MFSLLFYVSTPLVFQHKTGCVLIPVRHMRKFIRITFISFAAIFGIASLLLLLSVKQIEKNEKIFLDMQDMVEAIKAFQKNYDRLPEKAEVKKLSLVLPKRYHNYDYQIDTINSPVDDIEIIQPNLSFLLI